MATDAELLAAWRSGDRGAGSRLFDRHFSTVRRFFANKCGREVEDLVQATFELCVGAVTRFEGRSTFRTYLLGIANNVLRAHYRSRGLDEDDDVSSVEDAGAGPSTVLAIRAEHRALLTGLRRIPIESQVLLELYYWEQMSGRELGKVLRVPEDTARSRLRRAKILLTEALTKLEEEPGLIESTATDLERWANEVRDQFNDEIREPPAGQ